jgi:peptidoglycan biosynthesis protein MviN/MurJ (putative lipid II flippase)
LMLLLMPMYGPRGAVIALVAARFVEGAYLAFQMARCYETPMRALAPWKDLLKVLAAAVLAALPLYGDFWTSHFGLLGVVIGGIVFGLCFAGLLVLFRVPEAKLFVQLLQTASASLTRRTQPRG